MLQVRPAIADGIHMSYRESTERVYWIVNRLRYTNISELEEIGRLWQNAHTVTSDRLRDDVQDMVPAGELAFAWGMAYAAWDDAKREAYQRAKLTKEHWGTARAASVNSSLCALLDAINAIVAQTKISHEEYSFLIEPVAKIFGTPGDIEMRSCDSCEDSREREIYSIDELHAHQASDHRDMEVSRN
jgi:hypothetical protein